jgi:adenylate cyclase
MATPVHSQRTFFKGVIVAIAFASLVSLALAHTRAGEWLENGTLDARARWAAQPAQADPRIVIIDIDNASLDVLQDKLGRWPWPRRVWTEVTRYVNRGMPRVIIFDAVFGGVENEASDTEFANVIRNSGKVVLGYSFLSTKLNGDAQNVSEDQGAVALARSSSDGLGVELPSEEFKSHFPLPLLANAAAGLGSVISTPDGDATIRRAPLQISHGGQKYDSLAARAVQVASPDATLLWHKRNGLFDSNYVLRNGKRLPLDSQGRMLLLWHGDSKQTYRRLPIWEVICSIYKEQCPNAEHFYPPEYFRDKLVLVGASAMASYEARPTPMDPQAPGIFVQATAIDNLLNGKAICESPLWLVILTVFFLCLAGGALHYRLASLSYGSGILLLLLALYLAGAFAAYRGAHFAMATVAPCLGLVLSFSGSAAARYVTTGRELRQTRGVLDRYVAPQLVDYVMANLENFHLNGDKRELTILISDVRNFTTMTEKSEPMELISLLDDYLSAMTEIIFRHNGIVDKFIGDGILAYWGAFTPESNHAEHAAQAALEMIERVKELNVQWSKEGKGPIAIGVGINTGTVIFGNIGRGKKIEFTVIGDAVNLAARLEGLNKEFQTSIVIGESTRDRLGTKAEVRALGGVKVKGKTIETSVFELVQWNPAAPGGTKVAKISDVTSPAKSS